MKNILLILTTILLLTSCRSNPTLEQYFIENEDNENISMADIPITILKAKDDISSEAKKAIESVKKINILYLKKDDENYTAYKTEKEKLKLILKDEKYQNIAKYKAKSTKISIQFVGDDEIIDEIILFATDKNRGLLLARLIGNKMKPENMQTILKNIQKIDIDQGTLSDLSTFLK